VDYPKVLPPGKAGTIKTKVDTGQAPGVHTKYLTIKTNDPENPKVVVHLTYNVK
jgi:hypothetical protein